MGTSVCYKGVTLGQGELRERKRERDPFAVTEAVVFLTLCTMPTGYMQK